MHIFKKLGCATILPIFALLLGYFAFLILCGYIFVVIEEDDDEQTKTSRRLAFLRTLDKYNISYNNSMIQEIVAAAANVFDVNGLDLNDYTKHIHSEWDIGSSVFFAGTIVTTIGEYYLIFYEQHFCFYRGQNQEIQLLNTFIADCTRLLIRKFSKTSSTLSNNNFKIVESKIFLKIFLTKIN